MVIGQAFHFFSFLAQKPPKTLTSTDSTPAAEAGRGDAKAPVLFDLPIICFVLAAPCLFDLSSRPVHWTVRGSMCTYLEVQKMGHDPIL